MRFSYASGSRPLDGYTIKRGIGIGGFGEVYYATSDAGKDVAIKRIQRNLDVELRGVRQCLNLKHANLLSLYDIKYDDAGQAWVVMEYVSGESLKDVVERHPDGLPPEFASCEGGHRPFVRFAYPEEVRRVDRVIRIRRRRACVFPLGFPESMVR